MQGFVSRLQHWDTLLFHRIFGWNGRRYLDWFMFGVSRSADGHLYAIVAGYLLLFERSFFVTALPAFALERSIYFTLKRTLKRQRPFHRLENVEYLMAPPDLFSFPSGHTAAAFTMVILLSQVFPGIRLPMQIWAATVGFSRIYLGIHYPTDVLAGGNTRHSLCEGWNEWSASLSLKCKPCVRNLRRELECIVRPLLHSECTSLMGECTSLMGEYAANTPQIRRKE